MDPLVFKPYLRPQVWGGRRLDELLRKRLPDSERYGEVWELSGHPQHVSVVCEGPSAGTSLAALWSGQRAALLGNARCGERAFPWLVKYLDCHELLSVQVHPDDACADALVPGERGKTEAWVVLAAEPTAQIYAGLRAGIDRQALERHLAAGTVADCLAGFRPQPGDCVFLPAGTVHAVGGGVLMAEVQQTSDATFRLFDWNRLGTDGQPRTLHIEQALASIDWQAGPVAPVAGEPLLGLPDGVAGERLVESPYFTLRRYRATSQLPAPQPGTMTAWLVLGGRAALSTDSGYSRRFACGETVLVPGATQRFAWQPEPEATLLEVRLPE